MVERDHRIARRTREVTAPVIGLCFEDFALEPGDRLLVLGGAEELLRVRALLANAEG